MSRRQTTIRHRRGTSPCRTPPKLQLYVPREPTARALPRLPINALDERVRLPPWSQANQGYVGRLRGPLDSGCSTSPDSQVGWIQLMTRFSPNETCRVRRGRGPVPLRDHGAAPTSPPGGVLRQPGLPLLRGVWALTSSELLLRQPGLPLRGVWALTSSELQWAVPDGAT